MTSFEAVCGYLTAHNYTIRQSLTATQRGHDIVAEKRAVPTWEVYVEAKGEGSSKESTARFGNPFNSGQVFDHVAKAILKGLRIASSKGTGTERRAAIALPRNELHLRQIEAVQAALHQTGIAVFWVDEEACERSMS